MRTVSNILLVVLRLNSVHAIQREDITIYTHESASKYSLPDQAALKVGTMADLLDLGKKQGFGSETGLKQRSMEFRFVVVEENLLVRSYPQYSKPFSHAYIIYFTSFPFLVGHHRECSRPISHHSCKLS